MTARKSAICAGVSVVRSARPGSFSSFCSEACTAASIGTLVSSDSTSKEKGEAMRNETLRKLPRFNGHWSVFRRR